MRPPIPFASACSAYSISLPLSYHSPAGNIQVAQLSHQHAVSHGQPAVPPGHPHYAPSPALQPTPGVSSADTSARAHRQPALPRNLHRSCRSVAEACSACLRPSRRTGRPALQQLPAYTALSQASAHKLFRLHGSGPC